MSMGESAYDRINDYGAVKIGLASPYDIRSWSFGEVKKPETINYRTYRPEKDGLFCERIFGPEKDWECACGKYRGMKYKGMICDRCGVKVTHSRVRRKRMGHIELAAPVVHIWFFKAMPSRLGTLLDMKTTSLERIIYFQDYVVIDPGDTPLKERQLLTEEDFRKAREQFGDTFQADMGADAIRKLLARLDLVSLSKQLRQELTETSSKQKLKDLTKRLKVVESLRDSDNRPEWMVLECIPVIPPDLRPLVLLDSGNFATSDLNDLYRRIINRNNRLKKLVDLNAPEVIIRNEKRMLQQAVDALFDNNRCKRPVLGSSNRPLKSLTDMIKGKQGRFRENLLGKRVDYSARSVIVVGPDLRLHQCGLPKKIALELFQPFIIRRLKELGHADTIKSAKKMLERKVEEVWDILEEVIHNHPVLLNRAPTLHRMGIQAFEPVLVEGNAIRIHPLVCKGFNADFDGDQMAVHLPLSIEAQVEAMTLMMSTNNIFSPANGNPIISPTQDIVMGSYYVTVQRPGEPGEGMTFASPNEVFLAFSQRKVGVHAMIKLRLPAHKKLKGEGEKEFTPGMVIKTTTGRVIFNDILHPKMPYYNLALGQKQLQGIIADCYQILGRAETINLLDNMKDLGFRESTRSGLSFATDDLKTPASKEKILADTEREVAKAAKLYHRGIITEQERYNKVLDYWTHAREQITTEMMEQLRHDVRNGQVYLNPIFLMADSGARGGVEQIRQLAGMRGLMAKPSGKIIETPIKANFREGLSVLEYFSSTHGARKGLADTALKTADSGYLTRKLADVAQNVVITMEDCGTSQGITKGIIYKGEKVEVSLVQSIRGRVSRVNIVNPITDEVVVRENEMITVAAARKLEEMQIEKIQVRSPMTCEASLGICRRCYGMDLATGQLVEPGMAVGIIAAQSIGEPGTQLTMRTFHIGGVATRGVEEKEHKAKREGKVKYVGINLVTNDEGKKIALSRNGEIQILDAKNREIEKYDVPDGAEMKVEDGQQVSRGAVLCEWDPHNIPILAEVGGKVRYEDIVEGETMRIETDASGHVRRTIMEHKGDLHPQVLIEDAEGHILAYNYIPEKAGIEVQEGLDRHRRHPAGQDAPRGRRHAGHHRRLAPRHRAVRGPKAQGAGRHRRDRRPRRAPGREAPRQADDHRQERERHRARAPRAARQVPPRPRRRPGPRRRRPGRGAAGAARHPPDLGRGGRPALPAPRDPERLPLAARRDRRQAPGDHRRADAPQGAGRLGRRHGTAARLGHRQVRVPRQEPGADELRQDQGPRRHRLPPGGHRPARPLRRREPPRRVDRRQEGRVDPAQARLGADPASGDHQGGRAVRQLHLGGELPGDDQGADRGRSGGQGRLPGRPEGERDPGPPGPRRHRVQDAPGGRGPHPPRGAGGPGREGPRLRPLPPRRGPRARRPGGGVISLGETR